MESEQTELLGKLRQEMENKVKLHDELDSANAKLENLNNEISGLVIEKEELKESVMTQFSSLQKTMVTFYPNTFIVFCLFIIEATHCQNILLLVVVKIVELLKFFDNGLLQGKNNQYIYFF